MKTRPGTLFWFRGKYLEMLVKTEKNYRFYQHTLLNRDGELVYPDTRTEKIEGERFARNFPDDEFWGKYYERIDL
jgi:hypothetical protein